jgi:phage tail-like protein
MAETGARNDPFVAFRFEVRFDKGDLGGGFSECSGLNLETEVQQFLEGGYNGAARKFPTRTTQPNVTLKRGVVDRKVWDWYYGLTQGNIETRNATVYVYDPSGANVTMEFVLRDAFPVKWSGPELNASQSAVALETLELCHQGLERRQ